MMRRDSNTAAARSPFRPLAYSSLCALTHTRFQREKAPAEAGAFYADYGTVSDLYQN